MDDLIRSGKLVLLFAIAALLAVTTWNAVRGDAAPEMHDRVQDNMHGVQRSGKGSIVEKD